MEGSLFFVYYLVGSVKVMNFVYILYFIYIIYSFDFKFFRIDE